MVAGHEVKEAYPIVPEFSVAEIKFSPGRVGRDVVWRSHVVQAKVDKYISRGYANRSADDFSLFYPQRWIDIGSSTITGNGGRETL